MTYRREKFGSAVLCMARESGSVRERLKMAVEGNNILVLTENFQDELEEEYTDLKSRLQGDNGFQETIENMTSGEVYEIIDLIVELFSSLCERDERG